MSTRQPGKFINTAVGGMVTLKSNTMFKFRYVCPIQILFTDIIRLYIVELQWLEHLWNHKIYPRQESFELMSESISFRHSSRSWYVVCSN